MTMPSALAKRNAKKYNTFSPSYLMLLNNIGNFAYSLIILDDREDIMVYL